MPQWRPDQSFYPSPKMAMQAPPETLAYVAMLNPTGQGAPDALATVDVDPKSKTYGQMVGKLDMPNAGDELHHFGWNACSSCLCPYSPHPHMERRYLVVPGLRSSRMHIVDTKPDPRKPKIVKVIEPETVTERTGYTRAAHRALRPGRHLYQRAGLARRRRSWRHLHHGSRDVRGARPVGTGPRPAIPRLRFLVAPGRRHHDHQRVGHAEHGRKRAGPGTAAGREIRARAARVGPQPAPAQEDARPGRRPAARIRTAPSARPDADLRLRGRGDFAQRSLCVGLALVPGRAQRQRRVAASQGDRDSGGAGRPRAAAAAAQGLQGRAAARDGHQSLARRPFPLRLLLGNRRHAAIRRLRSVQPQAHRLREDRRDRGARGASDAGRASR